MITQDVSTTYANPMSTPDMERVNWFSRKEVKVYREIFKAQVHPWIFKQINSMDDRIYVRFGDTFAATLPEFTYEDSKQRVRIDATTLYNVLAKVLIVELSTLDAAYANINKNKSNIFVLRGNIDTIRLTLLDMYSQITNYLTTLQTRYNSLIVSVDSIRNTTLALKATAGYYDPNTQSWVPVNVPTPIALPTKLNTKFPTYTLNLDDIETSYEETPVEYVV